MFLIKYCECDFDFDVGDLYFSSRFYKMCNIIRYCTVYLKWNLDWFESVAIEDSAVHKRGIAMLIPQYSVKKCIKRNNILVYGILIRWSQGTKLQFHWIKLFITLQFHWKNSTSQMYFRNCIFATQMIWIFTCSDTLSGYVN